MCGDVLTGFIGARFLVVGLVGVFLLLRGAFGFFRRLQDFQVKQAVEDVEEDFANTRAPLIYRDKVNGLENDLVVEVTIGLDVMDSTTDLLDILFVVVHNVGIGQASGQACRRDAGRHGLLGYHAAALR